MTDTVHTPEQPLVEPSPETPDPIITLIDSLPAPMREGIQVGTQVLMALVSSPDKHAAFLGRFLVATMTMNFVEGICAVADGSIDQKALRNAYMVNYTATLQSLSGVQMPPEFVEAVSAGARGVMESYEALAQAQQAAAAETSPETSSSAVPLGVLVDAPAAETPPEMPPG